MYTTNLAFLFDLFFLKMQTDVIMQQTRRNNDLPPAEPIALNSITLFLIIVSLLKLWFEQALASTGVVKFGRNKLISLLTFGHQQICPKYLLSNFVI